MKRHLWLLGSLYVAQGLPFGFFTQALPIRMREAGVGLTAIGFSSLLALPWAFKFILAPTVDRVGTRRSWIIPLQLGAIGVVLAASFVEPEQAWGWVLVAVFTSNFFAATQDIATDGLAVDILSPEERGLGNGVQVAGYRAGMIAGGGALLYAMSAISWAASLRLLALLLALTTLPVLLSRERPRRRGEPRSTIADLKEAIARPGALSWAVVLIVYKLGDAIAVGMLRPMLVDRGLDAPQIAGALGIGGFLAGLLGALGGGWLVPRLGRGRSLALFGGLSALGIAGYALVAHAPLFALVHVAICFEHLVAGMATAALFTCMMDSCRPEHAATDYTMQASAVVIATGLGASVSGALAEALGYTGCFALASALAALGTLAALHHTHRGLPLASEITT